MTFHDFDWSALKSDPQYCTLTPRTASMTPRTPGPFVDVEEVVSECADGEVVLERDDDGEEFQTSV